MTCGELNKRLDIYTKTRTGETATGQGVFAERLAYHNVSAKIETLTGRQLEWARQQVYTATHKITLRPIEISVSHWIMFCDRRFDIGHLDDLTSKKFITLLVSETKVA